MNGVRMLRRAAYAIQLEGSFQLAVAMGAKCNREQFVAMGAHIVSQNVELSKVRWQAIGELNAHRAGRK